MEIKNFKISGRFCITHHKFFQRKYVVMQEPEYNDMSLIMRKNGRRIKDTKAIQFYSCYILGTGLTLKLINDDKVMVATNNCNLMKSLHFRGLKAELQEKNIKKLVKTKLKEDRQGY